MNREVMGLIIKRNDGSEIVNYDDPSFPSYIYEGWVAPNVTWERVPHFHEDIEIVTVKSGEMAYSVNGKTLMLREGDTIVVNSNQIHYSMSMNDSVARYIIFIIHPSVLMSSVAVEMNAVRTITDNPDIPYIRFRDLNEYAVPVSELMHKMPDVRRDPFQITRQFFNLWDIIRKQADSLGAVGDKVEYDPKMVSFKLMMHFIATSYQEPITLDEIAQSGNVSRSLCNKLFNQYVGESPINYLMHLRARKVAEFLRSGNMPMSQIASQTGFNGVSYMSETFRKFFGQAPREYKKQWNDHQG